MGKFLIMYGVEASIDISTTETPIYEPLGEGIENLAEALNEVVYSGFYLSNQGFGNSEVTGLQPVFTVSGKRIVGDPLQDYIFAPERKYGMGEARKSKLQVVVKSGTETKTMTVPVTIAGIQEYSGNATDGSAISFELRFNGKPTILSA